MSLRELLAASVSPTSTTSPTFCPQDIWNTLVNTQTYAGRELRDACDVASSRGPLFLEMAMLLTTPEHERTVDKLSDAGIFLAANLARQLRPDDAALLRSNEGLLLWLRYAAAPSAYLTVFDGSDIFGPESADDRVRIDKALRILVASGRDRSEARPATLHDVPPTNPLSHLCSQVAPHWLRRVLELGASARQTNKGGMPLPVAAMRAEALRLHYAGQDPLHMHGSLRHLAELLKRHDGDLMQLNRRGVPSVALLTFHGLCGAAEALLTAGADPNLTDTKGNTLMHHLAYAAHLRDELIHIDNARLAHYMIVIALRFGAELDHVNDAGYTPREWLPAGLALGPQIDDLFLADVRATAVRRIKALG